MARGDNTTFTISVDKVRLVGRKFRKENDLSTKDAEAFLQLYESDIYDALQQRFEQFLKDKLS